MRQELLIGKVLGSGNIEEAKSKIKEINCVRAGGQSDVQFCCDYNIRFRANAVFSYRKFIWHGNDASSNKSFV